MLLQIVDSVAKEEIVVGSCAVGDLLENNNATFAAGGHKPMETHSSQCRGITVDGDDEDECEGRNKNGVDMFDMELKLHSPAGGESLIYKWPLVLGDERDESLEMLETIRWVCRDVPELESILGKNEVHAMFDPRSYQGMKRLCDRFNGAIDTLRQLKWISEKSPPTPSSSSSSSNYQFASTGLLKHILQVCYNRAVEEPDKLNQYEPFSPEVYGETSFELVEELTKVTKFGEDDVFIDLGSGVGQVVLQVAGSTPCKFCYGIEKSDWPAKYSEILSSEFKKWMSFFGKHHSKFRLEKGDFLSEEKSDAINSASIIFVNNFAFGPQVDHQLKLKFANVKEGARIVSSRAFCPLNFHITDRNLSDIGTIMKVEELTALPAAVSWTDKPFAYFLHTIDRSLLEKYFNDLKTNSETGSKRPVGNERTKRKFINGGSVKSESGDDVVRNKKPRKQLNGETDSGVETVGNHDKKYAKKMLDSSSGSEKRKYKLKLKKGPKKGFTMKRGRKKLNSVTLSTLDIFHRQISSGSASFDESNKVTFNDQWMLNNRSREDQITSAHLNGAVGPIRNLMTLFERQMMFFLQHMHTSAYKEELRKKLESERRKSANLSSKISDLEMEVQLLRKQGTELLTKRMNETMPQSKDGSGLLKRAGSVLVDRSNFDRQMSCLREQIIQLEHKQKQLVALQHSGSNGILPTLHDLLTSPRISLNNNNVQHNTSDRLLPNTSSAYKNVMEGRVEAESGKFSMDMGETLATKNHKNTSSLPSSKKQPTKRMRTNNSAGSNPKPAAPRKKKIKGVEATDDHNNNNKTIPSPSNKPLKLEKLPESVRTSQHVPSNDQLRSTPQTQALQSRHRPQTTKQPLNVDLQILHQQQILRHHQQLQIDQQMLNFHRGQQEQLLQQHELKASEPTTHPCKKQIKLLSVAQDQQAIGHFPYKLVYNDSTDQTSSIKPQKHQMPPLPCDDTGATPTASDKILPSQAPFLSKLTAPNFTVVDFSQLVKTGATQNSLLPSNLTPVPTLKPLPSFPLPAHIFPPPNFMLYRPPMGAAPLMSPLSKPLFSEIHPSSGSSFSSSLSSRNASFISFSSPLLSLPLFQPTNLVSTSMACSPKPVFSKLHSSSPPSLIVSSSSPAASTSLSSAEVINLDMTNSSQESSQPIMSLKQAAKLSTVAKANHVEEDAKPSDEHSSASAGSYQQSSSSSSSSSVSSPSGKSGGSFSESIPFEDQVVGMNKFVDSRKEILASQ